MRLKPFESADIPLVAGWLAQEENHRWLDFGRGLQRPGDIGLRVMIQRDIHVLRLYAPDEDADRPVGIVGLSDVDRNFGTATLWAVLGDKEYGERRLTTRALSALLTIGFDEIGLTSVNAWTLEINRGGQRIMDHLKFQFIGRQRKCHVIDGRRYDRLWYDLLAEEHEEI